MRDVAAAGIASPWLLDDDTPDFERDLLQGLSRKPRSLSPKYFYDAEGSALFDRICELPEYYPTRAELSVLSAHAADIAAQIGPSADIIEFGAGSLTKIRLLLDALDSTQAPARYLPIDISGEHLERAAAELQSSYPGLAIQPIIGDYTAPSVWADAVGQGQRRVGFFPGSTLGNFHPYEAHAFLKSAASLLRGGGLLLGVDLIKDPARLHAAYNDSEGVTAAFNLNVLHRANRELGANFDPAGFAHYAFYQPNQQRIEMHLVSQRTQVVQIRGRRFVFDEGDSIHTESSYKYTIASLRRLAVSAGFRPGAAWVDKAGLFSVHWLHAPPL
jgi:dimethylhistidine N-methyltransferase